MKIGILAYQSACNFGANLQVLSTVGYLRKQGHEPRVINYEADDLEQFYRRITPSTIYTAYADFRQTHMPLTARCRTAEEIAETIEQEGIEAVIIGSDAVAQHHALVERIIFPTRTLFHVQNMTADRLFPNPFWGTFIDFLSQSVPMALLSASNQDSNYRLFLPSLRQQMCRRLNTFAYISARDTWTKQMYESLLQGKKTIPVTPDPVFAFNANCSDIIPDRQTITDKYRLPDKYILLSFLNNRTVSPSWLVEFERMAAQHGMACVALPFPQGMKFQNSLHYQIASPLLPLDWYALIKYSCGYVGHNMHPIVVSLHNTTPFFSFDNYGITKLNGFITSEKSSKIKHILTLAGLQANRISCIKRGFVAPTPDFVLDKILHFDRPAAAAFSQRYVAAYDNMMNDIIEHLKK